ncbi:MAG: ATP phosphoribosyltransferase [Gammaproteobacteria bacterium]|nr:ATP phosphoribosyltransferase [Gammaproteobacteria bacterium]|tara:strand:+ start:110698 stop:111324 length:627 start_codon:yes stop_codon:yes gene_type:complete
MERLKLAISKGKILDQGLKILDKSGIRCRENPLTSRKLIFKTNLDYVDIIVVRASDVPAYIESGKVDMGIVGKDTLLESKNNNHYRLLDLKIAKCKLIVAGKKDKILKNNLKVATKYPSITKKFFHDKGLQCSVLKLYGSIELAAVLDMTDVIVDLVETGKTLKENGLVQIEEIQQITSYLIVNKGSFKLSNDKIRNVVKKIESGILL